MNFEFKIEKYVVTCDLFGGRYEDDDGTIEDLTVWNDNDHEVQLESLDKDIQDQIEAKLQSIIAMHSYEAYQDKLQSEADAWLDAWKHGDFNE